MSKRPIGRPTKYRPEYCQQLIEHMSNGFSYETFAATIGCSRAVIYDWESQHPEFLDAKRAAFEKSQQWWEQQAALGLWQDKDGPQLNTTLWIFNMKNRFGWTDKREVAQTIDANVKQESAEAKEFIAELRDLLKTGIGERK